MTKRVAKEVEIADEIEAKRKEFELDTDHYDDQASTSTLQIYPVLPESLTRSDVPLEKFHAIQIAHGQLGRVVKSLPALPVEFRHLKRIKKTGHMLICPYRDESLFLEAKARLEEMEIPLEIEVVEVPARKPETEIQFDFAKDKWPTAFHRCAELEQRLQGEFNESDREVIIRNLSKALPDGCVIVNNEKTLASSKHGKLKLEHAALEAVRNLADNLKRNPVDDAPYLATGCDAFLEQEPCAMCAMALVHARVSNVFFRHRSSNGVLTTGEWQLHLEPLINHHYEAHEVKQPYESNTNFIRPCGELTG